MVMLFLLLLFQSFDCSQLYDIRDNEILDNSLGDEYFVVLHSGLSCSDCFKKLGLALNNLENYKPIYIFTKYSENVSTRKMIENRTKELIKYDNLYFIKDNCKTIEDIMNDDISPSLIYVKNDKIIHFTHKELFPEGYSESSIKKIILERIDFSK